MYAVQPAVIIPPGAAVPAAGQPDAAVTPGSTGFLNGSPPPGDGIAANPWPTPASGDSGAAGTAGSASTSGFFGVIQSLLGQLAAMLSQLAGGASSTAAGTTQSVADATFASKGDPHLSETGTLATAEGSSPVDVHFDSMTAHADLLDSGEVGGGYRLSTTVTSPNAKGVTYNASATVHLNGDRDSITLTNDGSYSVQSDGTALALTNGEHVALSGGADVTRNADGSLTIDAGNASGGSIATTLAVSGPGVDVSAAAHDVTVGGEIVQQAATKPVQSG